MTHHSGFTRTHTRGSFTFGTVFFPHILFIIFLCLVHQEALNKSEKESQSRKKRSFTIQLSRDANSYCPH